MKKSTDIAHIHVLNLNSYERSPALISKFENGYTHDWCFKLPEAFKSALDIRHTIRRIEKAPYHIPTQGEVFSFKQGDRIYDSSLAYTLPWGDALKVIKFAIQIKRSSTDFISEEDQKTILKDGVPFIVHFNKKVEGTVEFEVLMSTKKNLEIFRTFETTQSQFVRFLQQGKMFTTDSKSIDLQDLFVEAFPKVIPLRRTSKKASKKR